MFIGMFNFADDSGNLGRSAKKLKMQIFPADNIECEPLLSELIAHGILIEYSVNGEKYIHIKNFLKHQVINRPTKSNIPPPPFIDESVSTHGELQEGREGKGRDIGEAKASLVDSHRQKPPEPVLQPVAKVIIDCPTDRIIELYEQKLPMLPGVRRSLFAAGKNAKALRQRWIWVMTAKHERGERAGQRLALSQDEGVGWFGRFFDFVAESKFLTNDCKPCSLGWLVKAENFEKVIASTYHEREKV
jgi:hypothetical protein